jgi:hypothetical protein
MMNAEKKMNDNLRMEVKELQEEPLKADLVLGEGPSVGLSTRTLFPRNWLRTSFPTLKLR